jgi:hypothetical protein
MGKAFVDNETYIEGQICYLLNLDIPNKEEIAYLKNAISDLFQLFYECPLQSGSSKRTLRRFVRLSITRVLDAIRVTGYLQFSKDLKDAASVFLKCYQFDSFGNVTFVWNEALSKVPFSLALRACAKFPDNTQLAKWALSCLVCLNKLPLSRPDLSLSTYEKWVGIQSHEVKDVADFNMDYVLALRQIVSWLVTDKVWTYPTHGKHGPGNTTNGASTIPEKEEDFAPCYQSESIYPTRRTHFWRATPENSLYADVDKDTSSRRSITQESVSMMFAQQSIKRQIYKACDSGDLNLSRYVKFSDQSRSQELALQFSLFSGTNGSATVDMSWASDLISSDLVAFIFTGEAAFKFMAARTWFIDVLRKKDKNGRVIKTVSIEPKMYAGMGAATTFPLQTIVFTACAILSLIISDRYPDGHDKTAWEGKYYHAVKRYLSAISGRRHYAEIFKDIRVYGDDIIVPDKALNSLFHILSSFGLRVNVDKTFKGQDAVRESCGMYALNGKDITPLRFRIPIYDPTGLSDFAVFDAIRNLANRAYFFGYKSLSRRLVRRYIELKPLIASRELSRRWSLVNGRSGTSGSPHGDYRDTRDVEYIANVPFQPMYEAYRGDSAIYLGIISSRKNVLYNGLLNNEPKSYICALMGKVDTFRDESADIYHLDESLFQMSERLGDIEDPLSHGRVPRGTRFQIRVAFRIDIGDRQWAWAPTSTG